MIWSSGKACGGCQCTPGSNADRCEAWEFELDNTDFDGRSRCRQVNKSRN